MNTLSGIEFGTEHGTKVVVDTALERGAAVVHDYLPAETIARITAELRAEPMALDESLEGKVHRRQEMVKYALKADENTVKYVGITRRAPLGISTEAIGVGYNVREHAGFDWHPNEVIGHRYREDYFIGEHQDLTSARGLVVSVTVAGRQKFFVRLDGSDEETMVQTEPGTVIFMRGYNDDDPARRPRHRVEKPEEPRLALTIRQVGALASQMPRWDTKKGAHW